MFNIDRWDYSKRQRRPEENRDVDPRGVYSFQKRRMRPDISTGPPSVLLYMVFYWCSPPLYSEKSKA
jgi:hypothetical protein